ncbi:hypothetical protein A0H81_07013 [Grifola frondosa]|uniref:Uncharacterized protein n=1 Tax=Grifola frondosa TaxID=5627 RepID=A0A1C7M8G5_GRIFR|nr:hypothetical protein A0H81_07013 [Grifola frondosa]
MSTRSRIAMRGTTSGALPKLPPAVRRLGRKGKLYGQIPAGPDEYRVTVDEEIRILRRRHRKAERDERMDITRALTPVKDYMGGFTRPTDLRASNWFPGGAYKMDARGYESPFPAAYEPHTVFLLESRYPVIHGVGRDDSYEHVVGICREGDLPAVLRMYNSRSCPHEDLEVMDRARWPWMKPKKIKTINWWGKGETRESAMALIAQELEQEVAQAEVQAAEKAKLNPNPTRRPTLGRSASSSKPRPVPSEVLNKSSTSKGSASHARTFHSSVLVRVPDDKSSGTHPRNAIPTSSWSRPPRASQPESDNVVPAYYVERKRQRDTLTERKEEEGSLMAELNAGILSEGHAADIKPRAEKIPVEIAHEDGTIRHPSGFEPPTPETDFHPVASKPASAPKAPWTELLGATSPGPSTRAH